MAQRRMFSKGITNSSQFLMMPSSSQNLYFHLGMNADDDGFCEHFSIMRMTDSKPDDLKILHSKGFVNIFDDKVLIITGWKENNYLRSDRYTPSKYLALYKDELALLSSGIPVVAKMATQVRLGKVRLSLSAAPKSERVHKQTNNAIQGNKAFDTGLLESIDPQQSKKYSHADSGDLVRPKKKSAAKYPDADKIFALFDNPLRSHWRIRPVERDAAQRLFDTLGVERVALRLATIKKYKDHEYCPVITSPSQMVQKMDSMEKFLQLHNSGM